MLHAGLGKRLIGVDIVASAINDANKNAEINGLLQYATFYAGKAEKIVYEQLQDIALKPQDLVVVDPPREGMHPKTTEFLLELATKFRFQLLYISCNPNTMARDIQNILAVTGKVSYLQPVDMFPHTHHIETIGLLTLG